MDDKTRTEAEAAAFRRLVHHFRMRKDVQNIDLMNLAGFCRNCLAKWYRAAGADRQCRVFAEAVENGADRREALDAVVDFLIAETVLGLD